MNSFKRVVTFLLAAAMIFALAACGGTQTANPGAEQETPSGSAAPSPSSAPEAQTSAEPDGEQPVYGGSYTSPKNANPTTLFANSKPGNHNGYIDPAVEKLGRKNPVDNTVTPFLAESFTNDKASKSVTIKLKQGIKFSDGSDFNAEAVKWNFEFMMENKLGGNIYNPSKIECPDEHTVVVYFDEYHLDADTKLADQYMYSKKAYDDNGLDWCQFNPVGTGAFVLEDYTQDVQLKYVRNENYWQEGLPYLDEWIIPIMTDNTAQMTAFVNGELDSFNFTTKAINDQLRQMGFDNDAYPYYGTYTYQGLAPSNNKDDPWSDVNVRKACLLYGINCEEIAALAEGDYAKPYLQASAPGTLLFDEELEKESYYDPEKAKQMLADAGYPNGFETDLYTTAQAVPLSTALQASFKEIGVTVNVIKIESTDKIRTDGTLKGLIILSGIGDYDSLVKPIGGTINPGGNGYGKHVSFSDGFMELYNKARAADNYEDRVTLGKQVERMLCVDECYFRVVYQKQMQIYIQDYVHNSGFEYNLFFPESTWVENH